MYKYIYKVIIFSLIFYWFAFTLGDSTRAQQILASDNFEDGIDDGWVKIHEQGTNLSTQWQIVNGMYGLKVPVQYTIENSLFGDENWTDYQISFDMLAKSGQDKNFIFRYQQPKNENDYNKWYELHISGTNINLKKIGYGNIAPTKPTNIQNNQLINWKITVVGTKIDIQYKQQSESAYQNAFSVYDTTENPILSGKIGIRIGTGAAYPCEVYFDNIVVTDLSDKRTLLDVPFFSQKDPIWANVIYDSANTWASPDNQGIKDWGCALTSAAMILNYHGITKDATGTATTPQSLNQYLKENGGYSRQGHLNWPSIVQYANKSMASGGLSSSARSFDFLYETYSSDLALNDLKVGWPGIIRIITNPHNLTTPKDDDTHFVVSKGFDPNNNLYLADPLLLTDDNPKLSDAYAGAQYSRLARFVPYHDPSYLWIYIHDENSLPWLELQAKKLGVKEGVEYREITNGQFSLEGAGNGSSSAGRISSWQFTIPTPDDGSYTLNLTAPTLALTPIELFIYDKDTKQKKITLTTLISPKFVRIINFNYNAADANSSQIIVKSTFDSLKESVVYSDQKKWLHHTLRKHFIALIEIAEKLSSKHRHPSLMVLKTIDHQLDMAYRLKRINKAAYELITFELNSLMQNK